MRPRAAAAGRVRRLTRTTTSPASPHLVGDALHGRRGRAGRGRRLERDGPVGPGSSVQSAARRPIGHGRSLTRSASTASLKRGQASSAQGSKSRSVRQRRRARRRVDPQERARARRSGRRSPGELRRAGPVGRLAVAQLEAEAPVAGVHAARCRAAMPASPGNWHRGRLGQGRRRDQRRREELRGEADDVGERCAATPAAGDPSRSVARHAERVEHRLAQVRRERHAGAGGDVGGEPPRSRCSSRCGGGRAGRRRRRRRTADPTCGRAGGARVDPGGPAGSSRSTVPSSTATRVASVVSSLVTDASGKPVDGSPVWSTTAVPATTAAAACRTRPVGDGVERTHGRTVPAVHHRRRSPV